METEEVVVEITPEPDFGEVTVDDDTPPVKEDGGEPPVGEEEEVTPPEKDESIKETPPEPPKDAEELERIRKDNAALGYNLREANRRLQFLEENLRKEREKGTRRELDEGHETALSKIAHLKDIDPDLYTREWQRLTEDKYRREQEQEREANKTRSMAEEVATRRQRVEDQLHRDFPEILNQSSGLFVEVKKNIEGRYTPEDISRILANTPQVFYDIVSETNSKLRIKQMEAEKANIEREKRVSGQGSLDSKPKSTTVGVKLNADQLKFCKDHGYKPEEYAKFVGKGRR